MVYTKLHLYEILVPTLVNGKRVSTEYHKIWDRKVREYSNGLTILKPEQKGTWLDSNKFLFEEEMIAVRIACTKEQIDKIAFLTSGYYKQKSVMYYKISHEVHIKNYE